MRSGGSRFRRQARTSPGLDGVAILLSTPTCRTFYACTPLHPPKVSKADLAHCSRAIESVGHHASQLDAVHPQAAHTVQ